MSEECVRSLPEAPEGMYIAAGPLEMPGPLSSPEPIPVMPVMPLMGCIMGEGPAAGAAEEAIQARVSIGLRQTGSASTANAMCLPAPPP